MSSYIHFTHDERICLQKFLNEGKSFREIASILGRSPSTISREVNRNRSKKPSKHNCDNKYNYHHWRAQVLTISRRRQNRRIALKPGSFKYNYVVDKLNLFWSPEQIAMRMRLDYPDQIVGTSTIYRYIKQNAFPDINTCAAEEKTKTMFTITVIPFIPNTSFRNGPKKSRAAQE